MSESDRDIQAFIGKELHNLLFLEEFVFARNKFSPESSTEVELADAVVLLGETLLIYQIKERSLKLAGDAEDERRWFHSKVLRKATKQVRDSLIYLRTHADIKVSNERGHVFNLGGRSSDDILKIVVYMASENLPSDCRRTFKHVSGSAGFIHIIDARDYLELARTLRVPEEVIRYFRYREMVLTRFDHHRSNLTEAMIAGHFIGGDPNFPPDAASVSFLYRLLQDEEEWDLAPFLRGLHDHLSVPGISDNYYGILIEFAKLPRSAWRQVKKRILMCLEKVQEDTFAKPYRITYPPTDCGFVFIPVRSELVHRPDWSAIRSNAIQNFTALHKYDQRLSKCIGILIAKDGTYFLIDWCLIACKWERDTEIEDELRENFPFRRVKEAEGHGYKLIGD